MATYVLEYILFTLCEVLIFNEKDFHMGMLLLLFFLKSVTEKHRRKKRKDIVLGDYNAIPKPSPFLCLSNPFQKLLLLFSQPLQNPNPFFFTLTVIP